MGTPCNPGPEDGMEWVAELTAGPDGDWHFRCGCGSETYILGTYEDALQAVADHRALDPDAPATPVEGGQ